ncbi:hypothetical protein [Sphingobacterium sp. UDSM-2020]|uniref:hypothetical protein n=1 Tax=Sphingobacterium sp. UDSM-2020 TaxID=2795738 RepID=UPI001936681F|nr:hypothetical protein [Sphingobacterium sp. UDSM-2020]QQD14363.1 hypothetical protein JAZ75_02120 [Sphingobacterium sp. UDSM-2020]
MAFLQLKAEVRNFFAPYMDIVEDKILFPYTLENQVIDHERWNENGVRIPVSNAMWLVTDSLPVSVTNLFIGHSASDILCFCHYYPNWITSPCLVTFASLGLLPSKEQFVYLKGLFPNAKIHTVFDGGISGRVADCKVATWQLGKNARFSLVDDHGEFYCNKKRYRIPVGNFSLNRFERLSGIRAGIRTHKPKAPFETFYQSFTNGLI